MYKSFDEMQQAVLSSGTKKKVALAASHDEDALASVVNAKRIGIISAVLIGDVEKTIAYLKQLGESPADWEMIAEEGEAACAARAMRMVVEGKADIPMKGLMQTAAFLRALFDKSLGLTGEKALVSQATVTELPEENRLLIISDCAINIAPSYAEKLKITENAVKLAHSLGIAVPKVAVLAPVELVNPAMQSTIDAAMLSKAADRGQLKNCVVDGPFALDNAISIEAAKHKGITGEVAGKADILIMPDLAAGNIFTKSLHFFAHMKTAGTLLGPNIPAIASSRTDTAMDKYYAILTAALQSL